MEEEQKRNNRVQTIKRIIILSVITLIIIPIIMCIVLFYKLNKLEDKLDKYTTVTVQTGMNAVVLSEKTNNIVSDDSHNKDKLEDNKAAEAIAKVTNDVKEEKNRVYLTFDDGPSQYTSKLLDILSVYNVKATFFVTGQTTDKDKALIKRMYDEGHTVGMHSFSHDYEDIYSSVSAFKKDYEKISSFIEEITGEKPKYYRFPGGSSNTISKLDMQKFIDVLDKDGVKYYDWNAANMDATGSVLTQKELIDNILDGVKENNTSIVLMHDAAGKKSTIDSMPKVIEKLRLNGYTLLPIDDQTPLIRHVQDANDEK